MTAKTFSAELEARMANAIRFLAADAVEQAKSGHPGMPMGMADVATVLFTRVMKYDASAPRWPDRDRFVLSAGHGSMLLYALLHLTGHADCPLDQLRNFRQWGSHTAGHPEFGHLAGVETTTGPLGQGLANAVGMALAERHLAARFGAGLVDHHTWVIAGDGCLMEGISQEAISLAGHLRLNRLTVLWDDNGITIDGAVELASSEDQLARFAACGWRTERIDGHDREAIAAALARAKDSDRPTLIACRTVIGFGAPTLAGTEKTHGSPLGAAEIAGAREKLGWSHPPFEVPQDVQLAWRAAGGHGAIARADWERRLDESDHDTRQDFDRAMGGALTGAWREALAELKGKIARDKPKIASRQASKDVLAAVLPAAPELVGGSADLTGSNLTLAGGIRALTANSYDGRYIHYGIREHAMGAVMNGLSLHGGVRPYGGTFLVFTDYMRPAIRLSALMGQPVVHVMTHDSIGLGEDGPTHQPIEHLASLRAIPNLRVLRPADAMETAECWEIALETTDRPSLLALSRQGLPALRDQSGENLCGRGAYVLAEADGGRDVTLVATGSEVALAVEGRAALAAEGIRAAVVSMPCWDLFEEQEEGYRAAVLGTAPRIAIEAASPFGWERFVGAGGAIIAMPGFGASAPAGVLFEKFGFTAANIVATAKRVLGR